MRLARLSLAVFTLVTLAACSTDAVGPNVPEGDASRISPSGPRQSTGTFGSGGKATTDSTMMSLAGQYTIQGTISGTGAP